MPIEEFQALLDGLPPGWSATDESRSDHGLDHHYCIIHGDGHRTYATMDKTFTLEGHLKVYWNIWGKKYGC
jgi:hypothetical protein